MFQLLCNFSKMATRQQLAAIVGHQNQFMTLISKSSNYSQTATGQSYICSRRHFSSTGRTLIGETWPDRRASQSIKWNRAIAEADKHLEFPNILTPENALDEVNPEDISIQIRKILGSSHPLSKILKRLIYSSQQDMQVRGLVTLLWAKALEKKDNRERDPILTKREKYLAIICEMMQKGLIIHSGMVDVEKIFDEDDVEVGLVRHANKLTIIIGDLLIVKGNVLLSTLGNPMYTDKFSQSLGEYCEAEFMFDCDKHGQAVPTEAATFDAWETMSFKMYGSLLGSALSSLHVLNELSTESYKNAKSYGRNFSLAWKASLDIQPFIKGPRECNEPFSLLSLPVILQMEKDPRLLNELVNPHCDDLSKVDYKKIRDLVWHSDVIEQARSRCSEYILEGKKILQTELPQSQTKDILENIVCAHQV